MGSSSKNINNIYFGRINVKKFCLKKLRFLVLLYLNYTHLLFFKILLI